MAKIFPIIKKNVVQNVTIIQGGGDSTIVDRDRDIIERNEFFLGADSEEDVSVGIPDELLPGLTEEVVSALLTRAEEESLIPIVDDTLEIQVQTEQFLGAVDTLQIIPNVDELFRFDDIEELYDIELDVSEDIPIPVETIKTTVGINDVNYILPDQTDIYQLETTISEINDNQIEELTVETTVSEVNDTPIEFVNIDATVTTLEVLPEIIDDTALVTFVNNELVPVADDIAVLEVSLNGFARTVESNSGWTNPNNSLGNTTGTATTLTASSSGFFGNTSNTTNGDLLVDLNNLNLGDMDITSAQVFVETQRADAGLFSRPDSDVSFQISFDGQNFAQIHRITAEQGKQVNGADITNIIQNQTDLKFRAIGSVTSGTGLGAGTTVSLFRCIFVLQANRTYQ